MAPWSCEANDPGAVPACAGAGGAGGGAGGATAPRISAIRLITLSMLITDLIGGGASTL
jgi:hypothetical protein